LGKKAEVEAEPVGSRFSAETLSVILLQNWSKKWWDALRDLFWMFDDGAFGYVIVLFLLINITYFSFNL